MDSIPQVVDIKDIKDIKAVDIEWVPFAGGELEGARPSVRCAACRIKPKTGTTLCFECHRAGVIRDRALKTAATIATASEAQFQTSLPFEPVNRARLETLRAARAAARASSLVGYASFDARRRRAQIAARHALERIAVKLARDLRVGDRAAREREFAAAVHAAELQLPPSWLPYVVGQY